MRQVLDRDSGEIELSVVMPCLNERDTVGICVKKAWDAIERAGLSAEVVVVDNGSDDGSPEIAASYGARVVHQSERGYGNAYLKGFEEARGKYILMGDSDNTYDFSEVEKFVEPLRAGYEFVSGSRLNGKIMPGSMAWSHKYIGNPALTWILNFLFKTKFSDVYCGMRAFPKEAYQRIKPRLSEGMEFNLELLINAAKQGLTYYEIPITLHRRDGEVKLRSFKDGWRSLRFMLIYSPDYLFLVPGLFLFSLGIVSFLGAALGRFLGEGFAAAPQLMVIATVLNVIGLQICCFWICSRTYSLSEKLERRNRFLVRFYRVFTLERGILLGLIFLAAGGTLGAVMSWLWMRGGFVPLDHPAAVVLALNFILVGSQVVFCSFFLYLMRVRKEKI